MRSVGLLLVGLMLVGVALVPPGWQDERFQRFIPSKTETLTRRPGSRRRSRSISVAFSLAGVAFLIAGIHSML